MRRLRSFVFLTAVVVALCAAALPTQAASTTRLASDVVHNLSLAQSLGAVPSTQQITVGVLRRLRLDAGQGCDLDPRALGEPATALADLVLAVLGLELDRRRDREVRGGVPRALIAVTLRERSALAPVPADDERLERVLSLGADVEEPGALRSAKPL